MRVKLNRRIKALLFPRSNKSEQNCCYYLQQDFPNFCSWVPFNQRWGPRGHPWPRGQILKSLALASKPQVLGLGLEALGPRKLPCPRLEDSTIFEPLKFCRKTPETSRKICQYLFNFEQLEHRLSQAGLPPN